MPLPPPTPGGVRPRGERPVELNWDLSADWPEDKERNIYNQCENACGFRVWQTQHYDTIHHNKDA